MAGRCFAVGDEVLCLRNDRCLGVRNGTLSTIAALHPSGGVLLDNGIALPGEYVGAGHLGHAYASSIHKGQGQTTGRAFLLGSDALYREAGYVGLSRAREGSELYIVAPLPDGGPGIDALEADPVAQVARRLSESRAQELASARRPPGG